MAARFVVGIDLGTTNSAVACVDTEAADRDPALRHVPVTQVVGPGELEARASMPSFLLLPTAHEVAAGALDLPWAEDRRYAVGTFARDRGAELPHRLVSSAKSWLCNPAIDRNAPLLPWRGTERLDEDEATDRVSPVEASARYLAHLRAAWDHDHPEHPLAEQDVFVTVPASFDAVARELTVAAARHAGLTKVTLLEEPQAAFYAWLARAGDAWRKQLVPGDMVLVCDVGGGTTDFTLIEVVDEDGNLTLERVAVGDHILLGGDNMDLALAHATGARLAADGKKLDPLQQRALVHHCRRAKETLLGDGAPDSVPVSLLGRGSKLIGGTVRVDVRRDDAHALLVDGFFPVCDAEARPQRRRAAGLREMGLPYAHDPAVTRHLAEFLGRHDAMPTAILWNGGVMKAEALRGRVHQVLGDWCGRAPRELTGNDPDLAVALGAAYYGTVRRGKGIRIRGGTARAYYIGIESAMPAIPGFAPPVKAMCVAPFGMEEGSHAELPDDELGLVVGENVEFRFFASSSRKDDAPGTLVDVDDAPGGELVELDPVQKEIEASGERRPGDVVPVALEAQVTEVGTLELWCAARDGRGRWKLEYSVRERE
ncbi:MAG: Hsp70 family protein [Kofleriaceae bacterium]|nr:Hsp70 family protein [Myxococcales bacterium]MCB9561338.1 Hsp70 family protein [Kofleriaceae bacterium]